MSKLGKKPARWAVGRSSKLSRLRWKVQLFFLIALNPLWWPAWRAYRLSGVCLPILNCHGCVLAGSYCPIGVTGDMLSIKLVPWLALGTFGVVGTLMGRLSCGWACPFGFLQDLLAKIPVRKIRLPQWSRFIKYGVLVVMVFLVAWFVGVKTKMFFCWGCPVATLSARIPAWAKGIVTFEQISVRLLILVGVLAMVVFVRRGFCRLACPIGAGLALFNRISLLSIKFNRRFCSDCMQCWHQCPVEIGPMNDPRSPECVYCMKCFKCTGLNMSFSGDVNESAVKKQDARNEPH